KAAAMIMLLALPVLLVVARAHRYLQDYAPSNALAARVRSEYPSFGTALRLLAMASMLVVGAHLLATWASTGGPGWLNVVVLIAIWDAFKFSFLAFAVSFRIGTGFVRRYARSLGKPGQG